MIHAPKRAFAQGENVIQLGIKTHCQMETLQITTELANKIKNVMPIKKYQWSYNARHCLTQCEAITIKAPCNHHLNKSIH